MIKEKQKITKYNYKKSKTEIFFEYFRTFLYSSLLALLITTCLAFHARQEMIKEFISSPEQQKLINKEIASKFIETNQGILSDLSKKNFAICLHVGDMYESIGNYKAAELAYRYAVNKSKTNDFRAHYKLICTYLIQNKIKEAEHVLNSVKDYQDKKLIKFKTRSNIVIGDKYYSIGKFLSAAKYYEKSEFYYNKFKRKDKAVERSIEKRIVNSYLQAADVMVKNDLNSEAVRFLKKVEKKSPNDLRVKYKLAIVLSDLDPEKSVEYFEKLVKKIPQDIDYGVYCSALMKAANIADLSGNSTQAKYYRYKIHSMDMYLKRKVIYKNDIEVILDPKPVKKSFLTYPLKLNYSFLNNSNIDMKYLEADFVLTENDNILETVKEVVADKEFPLLTMANEPNVVKVKFKKLIFTKHEMENYTVKIYMYKDKRFKTLVAETKIPLK